MRPRKRRQGSSSASIDRLVRGLVVGGEVVEELVVLSAILDSFSLELAVEFSGAVLGFDPDLLGGLLIYVPGLSFGAHAWEVGVNRIVFLLDLPSVGSFAPLGLSIPAGAVGWDGVPFGGVVGFPIGGS